MTDDPYAIMQSYAKPTAKSRAGRAIIDDHLANRAAEQERAVRYIKKCLKEFDVCQVIAASGFGKTWVAYKVIADFSRTDTQFVSVMVEPGILLVDQAKKRFAEYLGDRASLYDLVVVCSDADAKTPWGEFDHINIAQFRDRLKDGEQRRTIILTTNASASKVGEVLKRHGAADLVIVDEAHHAAGTANRPQVKAIHAIPALKMIHMTATQKLVASRVKNRRSMDDPNHFGEVAYSLTFGEAAQQAIIAQSVLAFLSVPDTEAASMFTRLGEEGFRVKGSSSSHFKYEVAAAIVTVQCLVHGGLQRVLTFHNRKESAERFSNLLLVIAEMLGYENIWFDSITENTVHRQQIMDEFSTLYDGTVTGAVLSSCRVLAEGYDLPSVDGVVVVDPRMSPIDVTQTINRGSRFDATRPGKKNVVIIPVLGDNPHGTDPHGAAFSAVQRTIDQMRDIDSSITGILYDMAGFQRTQSLDEPMRGSPSVITDLSEDLARTVSLKILDPGITSWMENFELLKPLSGFPKRGTPLGDWCKNQTVDYRQGRLPEFRQRLLETLSWWSWERRLIHGSAVEKVMQCYSPDLTAREIADITGLRYQNVNSVLRNLDLPYKRLQRDDMSDETILAIADAWRNRDTHTTQQAIGDLYGVSFGAVASICSGKRSPLTNGPVIPYNTKCIGRNPNTASLTDDQVRAIVKRLRTGEMNKDIAADFGVHGVVITNINTGRTYRHVTGGPVRPKIIRRKSES